jgi:hypothetical protein
MPGVWYPDHLPHAPEARASALQLKGLYPSCPFDLVQGQPGSGEAASDEAGLVLDLLQAVPDDLDQVWNE